MGQLRTGLLRYALVRFLGWVAVIIAAALLLSLTLGGGEPLFAVLGGMLSGNLGSAVGERLAVTVPLAVLASIIAMILAAGFGALLARRPDSAATPIIAAVIRGLMALSPLWLGMVLVLIFAGQLRWLPPGGFVPWQQSLGGALGSLVLPAVSLAIPVGAILARGVARSLSGLQHGPLLFSARTRGMTATDAAVRLALPAAGLLLLGRVGAMFALIIAGAMIIENVFYLPGLGRLLLESVGAQDPAGVRAALFCLIVIGALAHFVAQMLVAIADPRTVAEARG
jgi:peptide/nickel transport system permease protein